MLKWFRNKSIIFEIVILLTMVLLVCFTAMGFLLFKASESSPDANTVRLAGIIVLIFFFLLATLGTWNAIRIIVKELKEVMSNAKDIAEGNMDTEVIVRNKNEIGRLAQTFKDMQTSVRGMVNDVNTSKQNILDGNISYRIKTEAYHGDYREIVVGMNEIMDFLNATVRGLMASSDNVAVAADQISGSSQSMAQGSTEQAAAVEQLSASMTEIAGEVKANAGNAKEASRLAGKANEEVQRGNEHMERMMKAMTEISGSSGQIGRII